MSHTVSRATLVAAVLSWPSLCAAQAPAAGQEAQTSPNSQAEYEAQLRELQARFEARLAELERRVATDEEEMRRKDQEFEKRITDNTSSDLDFKKSLTGKWYERMSLRGYTQFRYTTLFNRDVTPNLVVPADGTVSEAETFQIRRGRLTLSGDVTQHLYLYAQAEYFATVGGSGDRGMQARDVYADVALDNDKEHRFRFGLSKVPFGFVNLQSSQNRAAMERADAINSSAEGERDIGLYYYWAPKPVRELFRKLVKDGLKGSGDYGVVGIGAYAGQGPNRLDLNGEAHYIARVAYPFQLDSGQVFEFGVQAYTGDFVVGTQAIGGVTPTVKPDGLDDQRVGISAVMYPQPFGFEFEWNWGRGPELARDLLSIDDRSLQGGYLQFNYALKAGDVNLFPFARWNYFDGSRKFARNAPWNEINEVDVGFEWSPWPEIEVAVMYTHTFERTDTSTAPFDSAENVDRIGFQLQWNY